jgi:hypothetical protein
MESMLNPYCNTDYFDDRDRKNYDRRMKNKAKAKAAPDAVSAKVLSFPSGELIEEGKAGKGGDLAISNADFIAAVFTELPENAYAGVCSKSDDPNTGGWPAKRADKTISSLTADKNNYINCSSFKLGEDGSFHARKSSFAACHFILLDDIGTKVSIERLGDFKLSWQLETSPGNFQGGIILSHPIFDGVIAVQLLDAIINAELCDKGASGPLSRWTRLPVAIQSTKMQTGMHFGVALWNGTRTYDIRQKKSLRDYRW